MNQIIVAIKLKKMTSHNDNIINMGMNINNSNIISFFSYLINVYQTILNLD